MTLAGAGIAVVDVVTSGDVTNKKGPLKASDRLEEFLKLMDEENLQELEVSDGPFSVKLVRESAQPVVVSRASHAPQSASKLKAAAKQEATSEVGQPIKSPLAGVFYRSPSPSAPPFVKEGDVVTSDKPLCIIEAMKVLNEINAGVSGKILKIVVENGKPVQTGQTLFFVEPS